ncbi:MAG: FtsX-like permease family protein [Firmicutes bacterium]|nr:FtsX-like permease family protein [Bacillota bacterium]
MQKLLIKKLLRDMARSGITYIICILIVAIGLCGFSVLSICMKDLEGARDDFFTQTAFPDVFTEIRDAPLSVARNLEALPGVLRAEGRLTKTVCLASAGENAPQLKLFSVTEGGLAQPQLSCGQFPDAGSRQLIVGDGFFKAHNLAIGDELSLVIEGRSETFTICGSGISPENIYMVKSIVDLLPDYYNYDAAFINYQTMSSLCGQNNRANEFLLTLLPGVEFDTIKKNIEDVLEPYGSRVYGRADQFSVAILQMEIDQVGRMATSIPFVFLGVAAVILYISLLRLVEQQRVQAGTLMALGLNRHAVLLHYLSFGLLVGLVGGLLGGISGVWAAKPLFGLFRQFFSLPPFNAPIAWGNLLSGIIMATLFCGLVGLLVSRRLAQLMPAEALRPHAPKTARKTLLERLPGLANIFTVPGLMAIRALSRNPRRTILSVTGIACAYMISAFLMSMYTLMDVFIFDYIDKMQHQDITVYFSQPVPAAAALAAVHHPALEYAEGMLEFPVTLRGPAGKVDCGVQAIAQDAKLTLMFDTNKQPVRPQNEGIVISVLTAGILGVGPGDMIEAEVSWPQKRISALPVNGIIAQYMGNTVYMTHQAAARISDYRDVYTSVLLKGADEVREDLVNKLKQASQVELVENRLARTGKMREYMSLVVSMMAFMALIGMITGFAVIYTSSLISFEELKREISTMMMLGLPSKQCLQALNVSQWLLTIVAICPGIALTILSSNMMSSAIASDMFAIPDFVDPQALILAIALMFIAVWFSSQVMLRKIRKLAPVELLRERE